MLLIALILIPCLPAQNFSGSDDFSSYDPLHWGTETNQNGGTYVISGGLLNFTDGGTTSGLPTSAERPWILNFGSSTADWTVQMDFTVPINSSLVAGQFVSWIMYVSNSADSNDYFSISLENAYMGYTTPKASAEIVTDNSTPTPVSMNITSATSATLLISYLSSSQTLVAGFDDGSGPTSLFTANIGSGGNNWNMTSGETFQLSVLAENYANGLASAALVAGVMTGDNFLASPTAVPEPAAVALLAGLGVLGMVFWRRRRT